MLNLHRDKKTKARTGERWEDLRDHKSRQDGNVVLSGIDNLAR